MSTTVLLLITVPVAALGLLFLVTFAVVGMARRGSGAIGHQPAPVRPVPADVQALALGLVHDRKLIQAIKEVRGATGMGLKDAKEYCEALRDGLIPLQPPPSGMLSDRVRAFKDAGDHTSAVALVRAETGMSQAEATRFVDAIDG